MKTLLCILAFSLAHGSVIKSGGSGWSSNSGSGSSGSFSSMISSILSNPSTSTVIKKMTEVREQTETWDLVHDFTMLGLQLKVKYVDASNILAGAHVFVDWTLPGSLPHFLLGVTRLQMDVMLQAPQGSTLDMGLLNSKIAYKIWRFGVEHTGTIEISRKVEFGKYITRCLVNLKDTPVIDIVMETDNKNKVHITCSVSGTSYEVRVNRVRGTSYIISTPSIPLIGLKSMTFVVNPNPTLKKVEIFTTVGRKMSNKIEIIYNPIVSELGLYITGEVNEAPLMCRFVLAKDLEFAQAYISYNNVNYLMINMEGRVARTGLIPTYLRYTVSYDIMQGKYGEGKAKVTYDALKKDRTLSISIVPKENHAYDFEMKAKVDTDKIEVTHELIQDKTIIYAAAHKLERVENTAEKLMIVMTDKNTVPVDSPLHKLAEGFVPKAILGHMKRKVVFTLDWTVKNGLPCGIYYKETVIANGDLHYNALLDTTTVPYKLNFYYPIGFEFKGVNFGMQYFFKTDGMTAVITPIVKNNKLTELVMKQDLNNMQTRVILPTTAAATTFSIVRADAQTGEKTVEWTVYKDGLVYKVNMFTAITTPKLPYICTEATCKWTSAVNFDIDLATKIAGLIPAHTLAVSFEKNTLAIIEFQHNMKTAPFFCRLSCPLILPKTLDVTAEYIPNKQMVVRAVDFFPGEIVMDIMEPKYVIKYEADVNKKAPALVTVQVDLALRHLRAAIAFVRAPIVEISWTKDTLMANKMTVVTALPVLGRVLDLVVNYDIVDPLVVECKVDAALKLPVFGVVEVEQAFNWELTKVLSGSKMYSIRISTGKTGLCSLIPKISCTTSFTYDIPSRSISSSMKTTVSSNNMEVLVRDYTIYLMSNNVIV